MKKLVLLTMLAGGVLGGATLTGCSDSTTTMPTAQTYNGISQTLGSGTVTGFVKNDASGNPTSVGLTMTEAALTGLSASDQMIMLNLPSQRSTTVFDHIMVNWNPNGHPPTNVYDKPHFDLHFYTVDTMAQMMITPGPDKSAFDNSLVPAHYVTDSIAVPMMGVHYSVDSDFVPGYNFQKTLIYGKYHDQFYFVEPMITKAFIESTTSASFPIPQPVKYAYTGKYFPTSYSITHDATSKTYTISLDSMVKR